MWPPGWRGARADFSKGSRGCCSGTFEAVCWMEPPTPKDLDGDGELAWEEFETAFQDSKLQVQLRLLGLQPENCKDIFGLLDAGDGLLSVSEFFEGVARVSGPAQSRDLLRTEKMISTLTKMLSQHCQETHDDLSEALRCLPGARPVEREGSLIKRAKTPTSVVSSTSSATPHSSPPLVLKTGSEALAARGERLLSDGGGEPSLGNSIEAKHCHELRQEPLLEVEVLRKLEEVSRQVLAGRRETAELKEAVTCCSRRVEQLGGQLSELQHVLHVQQPARCGAFGNSRWAKQGLGVNGDAQDLVLPTLSLD